MTGDGHMLSASFIYYACDCITDFETPKFIRNLNDKATHLKCQFVILGEKITQEGYKHLLFGVYCPSVKAFNEFTAHAERQVKLDD
jgi:hypothetical protein